MNTDKVPNDNGSFLKIVSVANNISVNGNLNAKLIFYNYQDYGYWCDMIQATSFTNSIKKLVVCDSDGGTLINTRPRGDSTKYAASTEFVQNAIAAAFAAKGLRLNGGIIMAIQDGTAVFELGRLVLINELDDYVKDVTVTDNSLVVSKGDLTVNNITVSFAATTNVLSGSGEIDARGKTIKQLKDEIINFLKNYNYYLNNTFIIRIKGNIDNYAEQFYNDSYVIPPDNTTYTIAEVKNFMKWDNANTRCKIAFMSYSGNTYYAHVFGDVFYYDGIGVLTKEARNAADTWKVNNGNLIIDAGKTAIDKITVGTAALNYTGNGYRYVFANGKNALADIEIHTVESATDSSNKAASTKFVQAAIAAALAAKGL